MVYTVRNQNGESFEVKQEKLGDAQKDGFLPVVSNGKEEHRVSFENLQTAMKDGYKPLTPVTAGDKAMASLEGFARTQSLNTLPYLQAAGEFLTDKITDPFNMKANVPFSDRVDRARQRSEEIKEKAPGYALGGEIAGFVSPGVAVSKGVGAAGKALGIQGAAKTAPLVSRLASQSGRLATEGAVLGAAYTPDSGFTDMGARAQAAGTGMAFGAITPPALAAAGKTITTAAKAPAWMGKKVLSSLGGVKEEVINRYLQNPARIRNAKTFDELYETTTRIVSKLGDDLDNAKVDYDTAKKQLEDVREGIKNSRVEGKEKALEEVTKARTLLDESFKNQKAGLQSKASPSGVEPVVSDALDTLKTKVSEGSSKSFEILGDQKVSISKPYEAINTQLKNLSGETADDSKAALSKLKEIANALFNKGKTNSRGEFMASAEAIKKQIQSIDRDVKQWEIARGAFDTDYGRQLKAFRNQLDDVLKSNFDDYKIQMAQVSDDAKVLGDASRRFGKPEKALSRLGNLDRPSAKYDLDAAKALAQKTNPELARQLDEVAKAQRTLKSPIRMEGVKAALPENQVLRQAEMHAAAAKRLAKPSAIKEAVLKSSATYNLKSAAEKLNDKKEIFNRLKSFGEQSAEGKLQQVARGKLYAEKQLQELSKLADEDLVEAVMAARDAAAFDKTMFNGSRNVNLWSVLGAVGSSLTGKGGVGAAAGGIFGGPIFMAIGAVTGGLMDVYGPQVTKRILDGILKVKGPITESAIMKMNVPENVKTELVNQFNRTLVSQRISKTVEAVGKKVAEEKKPKGEEKWAQDGYKKLLESTTDQEKLERYKKLKEEFLKTPRGRRALVSLSELKPGTKAYENALKELEKEGGN